GRHTLDAAHVMGFADLFHVRTVDEEFHPARLQNAAPQRAPSRGVAAWPGTVKQGFATNRALMTAPLDRLSSARGVLEAEARAVQQVAERLGPDFERALELLHGCAGSVVTTGLGKAGFVAQKLSATLASTGVPSFYLHPTEAAHGDLGRLRT